MKVRRMVQIGLLVAILAGAGVVITTGFPACKSVDPTRSARLLTMAAEEAGDIDVLEERLMRQLNIADLQIQNDQKKEAAKTLALATTTLQTRLKDEKGVEKGIEGVKLISGWTSVSELSHQAGEGALAKGAYAEAEKALGAMEPVAKRAEYVLSLSEVCEKLHGKGEAGKLLVKGGEWAKEIDSVQVRRFALSTFSQRLASYDDLEAARTVMRNEKDARWRSDTLAGMARQTMTAEKGRNADAAIAQRSMSPALEMSRASVVAGKAATEPHEAEAAARFNQNVQYHYNYRNADLQSGLLPK